MTAQSRAAAHHFRYVHKRDISLRVRIIQAFEAGADWQRKQDDEMVEQYSEELAAKRSSTERDCEGKK